MLDSELVPWLFVGLIVFAVLLLLVVIASRREKLRVQFLAAVASKLGLQSHDRDRSMVPKPLKEFPLMMQGRSRKILNIMHGEVHGVVTTIFDLRYRTGKNQGKKQMMQTVICMESKELALPAFSLQPVESPFEIPERAGFRDVDFSSTQPEFAKGYSVKAQDASAVRALFDNEDLLERYNLHRGLAVEAKGPFVVFFRPDQLRRPEDLGAFMTSGFKILGEFEDAVYWSEEKEREAGEEKSSALLPPVKEAEPAEEQPAAKERVEEEPRSGLAAE